MFRRLLFALVFSTPGSAFAAVEAGVGFGLEKDLADPDLASGGTQMGLGASLRAPIRWWVHPKIALRGDAELGISGGQDRVEWSQYDQAVRFYSDQHWTLLTQAGLMIGPEISPMAGEAIAPYLGSAIGGIWARHWHSFQGESAVLLDPATNDVSSGSNIDPYTDQIAPAIGLNGGVRLQGQLPFVIEVELGYKVAFMRETGLQGARPTLGAVRTAYGFNPFRIGVNAVIPLGLGTEK